jgi:penicillin-binding protein 2
MKDLGRFFFQQLTRSQGKKRNYLPRVALGLRQITIQENNQIAPDFFRIVRPVLLLSLAFSFFLLASRLVFLGIIQGNFYKKQAQQNRLFKKAILPDRGVILDRNNVVLSRNSPGFRLSVAGSLKNDSQTIKNLATDLEITEQYILDRIANVSDSSRDAIVIKDNLTKEAVSGLESKYKHNKEIVFETSPIRENQYSLSLSHLIGYVGETVGGVKVGVSGLEKYYEKYLHGIAGFELMEFDALGHGGGFIDTVNPISGDGLVLSVDGVLQDFIYKALKQKTGAVVVQDIFDGSVIALVSFPGYDSNLFNKGISSEDFDKLLKDPENPLFNRAVSGQYPPGSVFKLITAVAGLSEKNILKGQTVTVPGSIRIGSFVYKDWKESGHGVVDVTKAIGVSSDVYFYAVGGGVPFLNIKGLGVEKMMEYAKKFGLGKRTEITIPSESDGFLPSKDWKKAIYNEEWYIGDDFITAIGQGFVLTTPLQINNAVTAIANGGYLFKPSIVKTIVPERGEKIIKKEELLVSDIVSREVLQTVLEGMRKVCILGGTAYPLFDFDPQVACKTGTAEYGEKDKNGNYKTHAWITVIVPYKEPKYALTVFLEGGGEGSKDAGPVAREILEEMKRAKYFK